MIRQRFIGYARSPDPIQLEGQLIALNRAGCQWVFIDRLAELGDGWAQSMALMQSGDCLIVREIKSLVHSKDEFFELLKTLQHRQIQLKTIDGGINSDPANGSDLLQALAVLDGLEGGAVKAAKSADGPGESIPTKLMEKIQGTPGKKAGRPRTNPEKLDQARQLYEQEDYTAEQACAAVGISRRTFFNYLAQQRPSSSPHSTPDSLDPADAG
ncbi:MAG: helix-turn-helix domain-containing protein [Candidatus Latescibacteria bacterium]|nr:helix-turn-helix domain-containing protein [Candidatus Latescibacterota bacterium]